MNKAHSPINWENYPNETTPINEENLNKMDRAIGIIDDRVIEHENKKLSKVDASLDIVNVEYDKDTSVFQFTKRNGETVKVDVSSVVVREGYTKEESDQRYANAIKRTYSGKTIVATDSAEAKFEGLRVLGRSEQGENPSPSNPQPIESVGGDETVDVGVYGGNLCDNVWEQGTISTVNGSNVVSSADVRTANYIKVIPYKPMYIKRNIIGSYLRTRTYDKDFKYIGGGESAGYELIKGETLANPMGNKVSECILKFTNENVKYLRLIDHTNDLNTKYFVGVYDGSVDDVYSDEQTLTVSTPNGLPGIKVTDASLATYTDANGQMWCADEIDFARGKYVRRVKELDLGSLTWNYETQYNMWVSTTGLSDAVSELPMLCETIPFQLINTVNTVLGAKPNNIYNIWARNGSSTVKPTGKAYYILAEPIETDLTAEQLEAYRALTSNYPTTTILNDENAHMEATLVADTKNHIEQNYVPLDSYKSLEARVLAVEQALA